MSKFPIESFRSGHSHYKDESKVKVPVDVFVKVNPVHAAVRLVFAGQEIPETLYKVLEDFGYVPSKGGVPIVETVPEQVEEVSKEVETEEVVKTEPEESPEEQLQEEPEAKEEEKSEPKAGAKKKTSPKKKKA